MRINIRKVCGINHIGIFLNVYQSICMTVCISLHVHIYEREELASLFSSLLSYIPGDLARNRKHAPIQQNVEERKSLLFFSTPRWPHTWQYTCLFFLRSTPKKLSLFFLFFSPVGQERCSLFLYHLPMIYLDMEVDTYLCVQHTVSPTVVKTFFCSIRLLTVAHNNIHSFA